MARKKVTDPVVSSVATRASPNGISKLSNVAATGSAAVAQPPTVPDPSKEAGEANMKKRRITNEHLSKIQSVTRAAVVSMLNDLRAVDHENMKNLVALMKENESLKSRVDALLEEKHELSDEVVEHTITNNTLDRRCQKLLEKNDELSIVNEKVATRNDTLSKENDTLKHQNEAWSTQFTELENKYESFLIRYERLKTRFSTLTSEFDEQSTQSRDLQTENDELRLINQELGQAREETRFEIKELEKTHLACTTDLMTINSNQQKEINTLKRKLEEEGSGDKLNTLKRKLVDLVGEV